MKILVIGDPHGKLPKKLPKADLILCTGDIGKADLARKHAFGNVERKKKGLDEIEYTNKTRKAVWMEIYNSTIDVLKRLTKIAPVYSILGNVGTATDYEMKKEEKKFKIKLPYLRKGMSKIKDFNIVINCIRNINGLRIGFLEYFIDECWVREFNPADYSKKLKLAKKESAKAKRILKQFGEVDILVCHQPPYGFLDKVTAPYAPKPWIGKHAGSKVILNYIKKYQPGYVFCGHIHEGKGKVKVGKSEVYNVGVSGDYVLVDVKPKF